MRFLLFNIAVAIALVYMVAGDSAVDMAKAAIDKAKDTALSSSGAVTEVLESATVSENAQPSAPRQDETPIQIKSVAVASAPKAKRTLVRTSDAKPVSLAQPKPAKIKEKATPKLPPITQARDVSVARFNKPAQSVGEHMADAVQINATQEMAGMTTEDASPPRYMSASERAGELVRLVDDMELFAARMLAK